MHHYDRTMGYVTLAKQGMEVNHFWETGGGGRDQIRNKNLPESHLLKSKEKKV